MTLVPMTPNQLALQVQADNLIDDVKGLDGVTWARIRFQSPDGPVHITIQHVISVSESENKNRVVATSYVFDDLLSSGNAKALDFIRNTLSKK